MKGFRIESSFDGAELLEMLAATTESPKLQRLCVVNRSLNQHHTTWEELASILPKLSLCELSIAFDTHDSHEEPNDDSSLNSLQYKIIHGVEQNQSLEEVNLRGSSYFHNQVFLAKLRGFCRRNKLLKAITSITNPGAARNKLSPGVVDQIWRVLKNQCADKEEFDMLCGTLLFEVIRHADPTLTSHDSRKRKYSRITGEEDTPLTMWDSLMKHFTDESR